MENEPLGIVVGKTEPYRVIIQAKRPLRVGEYVEINGPDGLLLGFVENANISSDILGDIKNYQSAIEAKRVALKNMRDKSFTGSIRIVGSIEELKKGSQYIPSIPPFPGDEAREANETVLKEVFSTNSKEWVQIGTLARNRTVPVAINLDKVASRHLGILAATGAGKSNLLAVLMKRISEVKGTMIVFDYHGEYLELKISGVVQVPAKINPRLLNSDELADILEIRENASIQRSVLAKAFNIEVKESDKFWDTLEKNLTIIANDSKESDKRAAERVLDIIQTAKRRIGRVLDPEIANPLTLIRPNHINIVNMLELTERQASVILSYYLEAILEDRKKARRVGWGEKVDIKDIRFLSPVVCAIEEAHTFIPNNEDTDAKRVVSKIAREGRKFGVSLIIVSQRPSRVDQDVLSQVGSLAVLRIVQPQDQRYIVDVSEIMSEELAGYLPSLNVGEAILIGQWVTLPSLVKVEKVEEKLIGSDISAVREWEENGEISKIAKERTSDMIKGF